MENGLPYAAIGVWETIPKNDPEILLLKSQVSAKLGWNWGWGAVDPWSQGLWDLFVFIPTSVIQVLVGIFRLWGVSLWEALLVVS